MRPEQPPRALVFLHGGALRSPVLRSHELARHFAERLPVVYVPFRSPVEWLLDDWRRRPWAPLATHTNVSVVPTPLSTFLSRRARWAAEWHGRFAAPGIGRHLQRLGVPPAEALLFVQSATAAPVLDHFPASPVFYDCADDLAHWHGSSPAMGHLYTELEKRVTARARWIALTIPRLAERFASSPAEIITSSNGVAPEFFEPGPIPADLAAIPEPRLLFLGIVSRFVCARTLEILADSGLGNVVLVGPVDPRAPARRLHRHPRLHWLGRREYEELAPYAHGAQVGLIPGTAARASDCVPAKLFMYSAAGLPVVGHHCSSLRPFEHLIRLAASPEEFVAQVGQSLAAPGWQREERIALAGERRWGLIAANLLDRMGLQTVSGAAGGKPGQPVRTAADP